MQEVSPDALVPHPKNPEIYGDEDVSDLVELIQSSKWIKTLVVTAELKIISGHRRWKAAKLLQLKTVPIEIKSFNDQLEETEALLLENASRIKTTEQKVREGAVWKEIESALALQRMVVGGGKQGVENFPHLGTSGKSRDAIASRVGLGSGRTYQKAAKVVEAIDELMTKGETQLASELKEVLNSKSVDAAYQIVRQSEVSPQESLKRFRVGDRVRISPLAQSSVAYIGSTGQVEAIHELEKQISINLDCGKDRIRFDPHELDLIESENDATSVKSIEQELKLRSKTFGLSQSAVQLLPDVEPYAEMSNSMIEQSFVPRPMKNENTDEICRALISQVLNLTEEQIQLVFRAIASRVVDAELESERSRRRPKAA